ncbi:uncharacterized protein LOC123262635 [Cotesia glomerata]|uniref:Uncharacterized protein n=1 Tax=Cotesia glomerata TaxID=32391 RepID=A0AAV7IP60_COTGL|nr:uncharacterized protein LOC123262635 [Cotesia glomerata]KAH0554741.1 hypothetical protein KQX54_012528 [Cotesia glomerata]
MIRKFVYFIFVATAASRALDEQNIELLPGFPTLAPWNLTTPENGTSELINSINEPFTEKSDEYYFYNYINVPDPITNTTESLISINQSIDGIINRLTALNRFNGTTIETYKLINSTNEIEFAKYENEIWLQTLSELERITKGLNKYNVPLIRIKRDPDVNETVLGTNNETVPGTVNVTVLGTVNGMVSGKINANFFGSNNETLLGTLNETVLTAADGTVLGTFNGVVIGTINRTASESIDRMVLRTIDGTVLGTDNRIVLGTVIDHDKGPILRKPKRPVSWVSETENDGTGEEVVDENINLIRESVFRRLRLTLRKKRFNNITDLFNEFLRQQTDGEEEEEDEDEDTKEEEDDYDEVYTYSFD